MIHFLAWLSSTTLSADSRFILCMPQPPTVEMILSFFKRKKTIGFLYQERTYTAFLS
jgi:hypothetical protein